MKDESCNNRGQKKAKVVNYLIWDNLIPKGRKKMKQRTGGLNRKQEADWIATVSVFTLTDKVQQFHAKIKAFWTEIHWTEYMYLGTKNVIV